MLARQVIRTLRMRVPFVPIVLTTMTDTGYDIAEKTLPEIRGVTLLPLDLMICIRRFLDSIQPTRLIILETELWPNLIEATYQRGIPIGLINGRISARSFPRYRFLRFFFRHVLSRIDYFAMQTSLDLERIIQIGASPQRVITSGNIKFDVLTHELNTAFTQQIKRVAGWRDTEVIITAGSTHPGEESMILDAYLLARHEITSLRLIIAPRHLDRLSEIRSILSGRALSFVEVDTIDELQESQTSVDVVILNVMGYLLDAYYLGHISFVGGSLVAIGGHNVLEPASLSRPVITGTMTSNFAEAVNLLSAHRAIRIVRSVNELADSFTELAKDEDLREELGEKAHEVVVRNQGASTRTIDQILSISKQLNSKNQERQLKSVIPSSLSMLRPLAPFSARAFHLLVSSRNRMYDLGWLKTRFAPIPIVSVGNITVGGTGKTPMSIFLAESLSEMGVHAAIVSRGYGGSQGVIPTRVPFDGVWREFGDEPILMARKLANTPVIVSRDRYHGVLFAKKRFDAELVILDDGFQHRQLDREVDLLLIDARHPPYSDAMLPLGGLRDPVDQIARSNLIVLTHVDESPHLLNLEAWLHSNAAGIPIFKSQHVFSGLYDTSIDSMRDPESMRSQKTALLCGIASPDSFRALVQKLGAEIVDETVMVDHHPFTRKELDETIERAIKKGAESIITTAKDHVRLMHLLGNYDIPVFVLEISIQMDQTHAFIQKIMKLSGI